MKRVDVWHVGVVAALLICGLPRFSSAREVSIWPIQLRPLTVTQAGPDDENPLAVRPAQDQQKVAAPKDETPAYRKWWFWALTAAVVGGTVALGAWAVDPNTPPARGCSPGAALCFGEGRPR